MLLTADLFQKLGGCRFLAKRLLESLPLTGTHPGRREGAGLEFQQYRPYAVGDDLRDLDWRLYARSDSLQVRTHRPEVPGRLAILLDASASMGYQGQGAPCTKLQYAALLAACAAWIARRQGDQLALFVYQEELMEGSGTFLEWEGLCRTLNFVRPAGVACPRQAWELCTEFLGRRGTALWISDFWEGEQELRSLCRGLQEAGGLRTIQVLDPDEVSLPATGMRRFQDAEQPAKTVDALPESAREDYQARVEQYRKALGELFLSQEIPFQSVTTTEDPAEAVRRLAEG